MTDNDSGSSERRSGAKDDAVWEWAIPALLGLSLGLNIVALFAPFMDARFLLSSKTYSLPTSILMLWRKELFALAVIVLAFSVCFPLLKLAMMIVVRSGVGAEELRGKALRFVEMFGKWSMLDVFLVCLMLALANDQFLVSATPRWGVLCFMGAVLLSMFTGELMRARVGAAAEERHAERLRGSAWLVAGSVVSLALLAVALTLPCLRIDDWLLADRPVSIVLAVAALWSVEAWTLSLAVAAFLVVTPFADRLLTIVAIVQAWRGQAARRLARWRAILRRWAMLDVFALALGVFLVEGKSFVQTELSYGVLGLVLALGGYWALSAAVRIRADG